MTSDNYICKIILTGAKNSGIYSLSAVYCTRFIVGSIQQTFGVDFYVKKVKLDEEVTVTLQIWVLAQNEEFNRLFPDYMDGTDGLIILFDVTDKKTFKPIGDWIEASKHLIGNIPIFIVGNKADLPKRGVEIEEAIELSKDYGGTYEDFISVKTGQNVEDLFRIVAEYVIQKKAPVVANF